jgi:Tfp pilus assembly protein PilF
LLAGIAELRAQAPNLPQSNARISGVVFLEANNQPMSQVIVSLHSEPAGISRSVLTDYEGKFEVRDLTPGVYEIGVEESGYEPTRIRAEVKDALSKLVLKLKPAHVSSLAGSAYTVSVAQLKIPDKARAEYKKGLERMEKNDMASGLIHLKKAIQVYPDFSLAYYEKGVVESKAGHPTEALESFYKAIDLSGGNYPWAEFGVGFALCQQGKPVEAEPIIRKALETEKDSPEGYVVLGMALLQQRRVDEAEQNAHEALLRKPKCAEAYLVLSYVYASRGAYRAQVEALDTYLRLLTSEIDRGPMLRERELANKKIAEMEAAK